MSERILGPAIEQPHCSLQYDPNLDHIGDNFLWEELFTRIISLGIAASSWHAEDMWSTHLVNKWNTWLYFHLVTWEGEFIIFFFKLSFYDI